MNSGVADVAIRYWSRLRPFLLEVVFDKLSKIKIESYGESQ